MKERGILTVVSGFAGSGKGTLMRELTSRYDNYALSVSATTRDPRPGEKEGREYFFKSTEEFKEMIETDAFIEYAQYVNHYYGTPREYVEAQLMDGKDVILEIEIQGALQVKKKFPETLLLFVTPPSAEILKKRLVGRGTETMPVIEARLSRAAEEVEGIGAYDYLIINDQIEECVNTMHHIIRNEHMRASRNIDFINKMKEGLRSLSKGE